MTTAMTAFIETDAFKSRERLKELRVAHRELDSAIDQIGGKGDQLLVKRLKKRKLLLKDMIARLESSLIPNLNA